jgi:hypothetical protein
VLWGITRELNGLQAENKSSERGPILQTPEVRSITKTGCYTAIWCYNFDESFLDEVHFGANGAFFDDQVTWQIDFEL